MERIRTKEISKEEIDELIPPKEELEKDKIKRACVKREGRD